MTVSDLYPYLSRKFETTCDSRMFSAGTVLEIRSIDIRKFKDILSIRFRCDVNVKGTVHSDIYLNASDVVHSIGYVLKEII